MSTESAKHPWAAVWALMLGFFMIMLDSTIVSVATPRIMDVFDADIVAAQWVQSAYLLALAVPMLFCGRLGDRYGPKNLTIIGLAMFAGASVWCGLSTSIGSLIAARAVQGIGAACLSPQSMALITRIFPPHRRGAPLGLWGGVAGVAMLVGPLLGGFLVDSFSWRAIFFINVPIGLLAIAMTAALVPRLPRHRLGLDPLGALLCGIGLLSLVTGLQEGERYRWGHIWGPLYIWGLIGFGVAVVVAFAWWERSFARDPLVPTDLFRRRNFTLGSTAILVASFSLTAVPVPLMYYYQIGRGLAPSQAAVILIPMAIVSGLLAPAIGRATARIDPRRFSIAGPLVSATATVIYFALLTPQSPMAWFFVPSAIAGVGSALTWGPLSIIASHDLAARDAGTGSAIYNVLRQLGAVMGSAAITSMMESRLSHELPGHSQAAASLLDNLDDLTTDQLAPFITAMAESLLLPLVTLIIAALIAVGITQRAPERQLSIARRRIRALTDNARRPQSRAVAQGDLGQAAMHATERHTARAAPLAEGEP